MVEKMKYINIMGHIDDFDRVIGKYISKYDIQFEYALKELTDMEGIFAFDTVNPYISTLRKAKQLINIIQPGIEIYPEIAEDKALDIIDKALEHYQELSQAIHETEEEVRQMQRFLQDINPYLELDIRLEDLAKFEFITYRFGKMPSNNYKQFETFLYSDKTILFVTAKRTKDYIHGMYFVTKDNVEVIDSTMSSFQFERIWINYELGGDILTGSPKVIHESVSQKIDSLEEEIQKLRMEATESKAFSHYELIGAYQKIQALSFYYDVRKYAAKTQKDFYIFVGWMTEGNANMAEKELDKDPDVVFTAEDGTSRKSGYPPTSLKNFSIFRPFEFFVKMYGVPAYHEIDPTFLIAMTYTFLFGMMFGDVGQGAVLTGLGAYLYKKRGMHLGSIIMIIGISSVFFGFMYGSVFGFEHWIEGLWMKPSENILRILMISVGFGIVLIFVAMMLNIINAIRQKNVGKLLFGPNGISGVIFYGAMIYIALILAYDSRLSIAPIAVLAAIALLMVTFHHPLSCWVQGKSFKIEGSIFLFLFETFIEMFESLLTYFTNTVSFVRVGAFALSHAGIMHVVFSLAETSNGGINPLIVILGNILVIALEGLIAGIQALRLDFYEIFGRFFSGDGREFVPYKNSGK